MRFIKVKNIIFKELDTMQVFCFKDLAQMLVKWKVFGKPLTRKYNQLDGSHKNIFETFRFY